MADNLIVHLFKEICIPLIIDKLIINSNNSNMSVS